MNQEFNIKSKGREEIICDFCKQPKDFRIITYNGKDFVCCKDCEDKPKTYIPPQRKTEKKQALSAIEELKQEKKRFRDKMKRIELKDQKKMDNSLKMGVGSKRLF